MKTKRFLALVVSLVMVLSIVPAFSLTASAASYTNGGTFTYDGVTYNVKSDNLVYNGDFSKTSASGSYITFDGWKGGYVNSVHLDLGTVPMASGSGRKSDTSMHYTYTEASGDTSAYVTTPSLTDGMTGTSWHVYPYTVAASEGYQFGVISNWFKDSSGAYLKAEAGKTYYMTFKMKASSVSNSDNNEVIFGAYTVDGSKYENTPPGALTGLTSVLNSSITPGKYISTADTWVTMETVATASADGYFAFQNYYAYKWGVMSFTDFEIYEVEAQASSATTIKNALNELTIDNSTNGENITLPASATDILGTKVDVTWTSSDTSLVTNTGVYANTGTSISTITLTPSATFEGETVTGNATTVMVFPKSRAGEQYSTGSAYYTIGTNNLIEAAGTAASFEDENGNFSLKGWKSDNQTDFSNIDVVNGVDYFVAMKQESGWSKGVELEGTYYTPDGNWSVGTRWHDGLGGLCTFNTVWSVEPGTYYMSFYAKSMSGVTGEKGIWAFFTTEQKFGSAPTDWGTTSQLNRVTTTTDWQKYEYVFDVTESGYIGFFGYNLGQSSNWSYTVKNYFDDFELYEMTKLESHTVTLNITGTDGSVVKTLSSAALTGESVSFAAQSFTANGVFYTTEAKTYTNITADATYTIAATADTTRIATTNAFPYDFEKGTTNWSDTNIMRSVGWWGYREAVLTFPLTTPTGSLISEIDLTVNIQATNTANARCVIYAIDPSLVGNGTMEPAISGATWDDTTTIDTLLADLKAVQVASTNVNAGYNTITLDLANASSLVNNGTVALLLVSNDEVYTYSATSAYPPYLSSTYTTISSITYDVNYVDESGNTIKDATTVEYVPGTQYGYDDEVICPGLDIPAISGYIFKTKSVSDTTITLTYREVQTTDYFFDNITDMDTRFVSLNMLGAHDAFTAGMSADRGDAAGIKQGDEGSIAAVSSYASTFGAGVNYSKAQNLDALELLEAGVRYFDIRLSRSDADASNSFKYASIITISGEATHTNGVFYTTHGLLGTELEPILYTIAQWVEAHPGEVVVLDFQEVWDSTNGRDGNGSGDSGTWNAINSLLTTTGINDLVRVGKQALADVTYGTLTNNKAEGGIVLFGRHGATNNNIGKFNVRGTGGTLNMDGRMYSYYDSDAIGSSYNASYIQKQVDYLYTYNTAFDTSGDHPIYWMFRVLQGQSQSSNLLNTAASDNTKLLSGLQSNPEWLTALPVIMVDGVGSNTDDIVSYLKQFNVPTVTVNYVNNGTTVYSEAGGLVGTLYTNDGFYSTPWYKLVNDANGEYYVSETFYTKPANGDVTKVISGSTVEVEVTKLGNVYTTRLINGVHCVLNANLTDNGAYTGMDNFGAFTWGSDHDRIGVAVLEADADASAWMLTGTEARKYFNSNAGVTKFYAVPAATYRALDLTNKDNLTALLTDSNLVGTLTHGNCGEAATGTLNLVLDSEKMAVAAASGEVVIIGDSISGLYGLAGSDTAIVSGWSVTTDGTETVVTDGSTYTLPSTAIVYVDSTKEETVLYAPGATTQITSDMKFMGYTDTGLEMVNGAQVRIGGGVDNNGKVGSGSGLRFITKVDYNDTVASLDGVEVGVVIVAEDSQTAITIPATRYQDEDNSVFTTALTNLKEGNYNRKFTAYPYVSYKDSLGNEGGAVVGDQAVTRSIYQVAAGLLVNGSDEEADYDNTALESEALCKVLNAYVNQTGIRLSVTSDGLTAYTGTKGAYSGDAFFEVVSSETVSENVYAITIKPVGDKTTINSYWQEYIRINNNNSAIKDYTSLVENEGGSVTITFDYANYLEAKDADTTTE